MGLAAGRLDRRVQLERLCTQKNAFNEDVPADWRPIGTVAASHEPVRDGERWGAGEISAEMVSRFRVRWAPALAGLDVRDRLLFEDRVFNIVAVKEIGRREGLEITGVARAERGRCDGC